MPEVPADQGRPALSAYTRYLAPAALYAINPASEETARAAAAAFRPEPVRQWELPRNLLTAADLLTAAETPEDDE